MGRGSWGRGFPGFGGRAELKAGLQMGLGQLEKIVGVPKKSDWCDPSRVGPALGWSLGHVLEP